MIAGNELKDTRDIEIVDVVLVNIVSISLISVAMLCVSRFNSVSAVVVGLFSGFTIIIGKRYRIILNKDIKYILLLIVLIIALFFRSQPYQWVMGFQDPGTYVNMAAYYNHNGSTFIKDSVRERLVPHEKTYWDMLLTDDLYKGIVKSSDLSGVYPRGTRETQAKLNAPKLLGYMSVIPGIYYKDLTKSEYVFQFYPLHPLWMAIFSFFLGEANGVYSLPFFALLTIIMFYRLAKVLSSGNENVGLMAAGLLAVNPLHSFFSKFPVTEVCFLFFTISGFYYLAAYLKDIQEDNEGRKWYLAISVALFLCSFLTRYTGFLYMPFFYFMTIALMVSSSTSLHGGRKSLLLYSVAVMGAYIISLCYGLIYSYPYTMEGLNLTFGKAIVLNWRVTLPVILLLLVLLPLVAREIIARSDCRDTDKLLMLMNKSVVLGFFIVICIAAIISFKMFQLRNIDGFMSAFGVVAVSYMSPFAFILLMVAYIKMYNCKSVPITSIWLGFFVLLFWAFYVVGMKTLPYQYYYARYALSEVIPYSFLIVVLYVDDLVKKPTVKSLAYIFLAAIMVYSLYFTSCQYKGREADGAYQALKKIAEKVKNDDILFVTFNDFKLLMPLKIFFDLPVFRIEEADIVKCAGNALVSSTNAYILSKKPVTRRGVELFNVIDYRQGRFEHVQHIPTKFSYVDEMKLYLYRVDKKVF